MAWVLRLIGTGADGQGRSIDVLEISRPDTLHDIAGLGPTLPEAKQLLDRVQAHLSALLTYRVAAGVLAHLLPVAAGKSPETFRSHTLKLGEQLRDAAAVR